MNGLGRLILGRWATALPLACLSWIVGESPAFAGGGGWGFDRVGHWGEYGLGPHIRRPYWGPRGDGYPYFTHPLTYGPAFVGYTGDGRAGYPYYGPYTGAPPAPERWPAVCLTPLPARRIMSSDGGRAGSSP